MKAPTAPELIVDPLRNQGARQASGRPRPGEYALYLESDLAFVAGDDAVEALVRQGTDTMALFTPLREQDVAGVRYAPNKWSIKEVLGHLSDDERIFAYRALCIARSEPAPLPGFDQDRYQDNARHEKRSLRELIYEYIAVRSASVALFSGLVEHEWQRWGTVSGYHASVRGLAFHIAAHELRHVRQLRSLYLVMLAGD